MILKHDYHQTFKKFPKSAQQIDKYISNPQCVLDREKKLYIVRQWRYRQGNRKNIVFKTQLL